MEKDLGVSKSMRLIIKISAFVMMAIVSYIAIHFEKDVVLKVLYLFVNNMFISLGANRLLAYKEATNSKVKRHIIIDFIFNIVILVLNIITIMR